jgi:hypothetical protein
VDDEAVAFDSLADDEAVAFESLEDDLVAFELLADEEDVAAAVFAAMTVTVFTCSFVTVFGFEVTVTLTWRSTVFVTVCFFR